MSATGIKLAYSGGSNYSWLNLDSGNGYTDIRVSAFDYARVVEKGGMWTPWIEVEGPVSQSVSLKIVFPLFFDYTKSPPQRKEENVAFFKKWVIINGRSFNLQKN